MQGRFRRALLALAAALVAVAALGASPAGSLTITPVATGLDNPRGMAFGPNGALYIAEAGEGGTDYCFEHPALGPVCGGMTGGNPNSVAALPSGQAVADAGANDLLWVDTNGNTSLLAVFDVRFVPFGGGMIPMQPVPTSVVTGPDGAFYVGQLTGFPFPMGAANVFRVVPGQAPTVYASGFTNVLDIAFGSDGSLYVLEISHFGLLSGSPFGGLWRVPPGGGTPQLLTTDLILPGGIAVAPDGSLDVGTCAPCANDGGVVRIVP